MQVQDNHTLTDKEAAAFRRGILETHDRTAATETATRLHTEAKQAGFTHERAAWWLDPFDSAKGQEELSGLTRIQAFVALGALTRAHAHLTAPFGHGVHEKPFEKALPDWQTMRVAELANAICCRASEVKGQCAARLESSEPLIRFDSLVSLVSLEYESDDPLALLVLEIAERVKRTNVPANDSPDEIKRTQALRLSSNALEILEPPITATGIGARQEALAPMLFKSVRAYFDHPLIKARMARG